MHAATIALLTFSILPNKVNWTFAFHKSNGGLLREEKLERDLHGILSEIRQRELFSVSGIDLCFNLEDA